ncbi:hypothetical protein IWX90DRAFT_86546 [Phyllosticta citrichinensis]|uniref:Uncharacterized protein n=1 Tax=Phyllosticta citrichinensis TaxID=1130410 RepID=A0ABR1XFD2_9PEZI
MFPPVPATHQVFHHAPAPLLSLQAESSLPVVCNVGSAAAGWWELQLLVAVAVLLRDPSLSPVAPPSLSTSLSTRHHCNELPTFSSWTAVNWTDEAEARASEYETCTLSPTTHVHALRPNFQHLPCRRRQSIHRRNPPRRLLPRAESRRNTTNPTNIRTTSTAPALHLSKTAARSAPSQWDFEDFMTPEKHLVKVHAQNERHFGWNDDMRWRAGSAPHCQLAHCRSHPAAGWPPPSASKTTLSLFFHFTFAHNQGQIAYSIHHNLTSLTRLDSRSFDYLQHLHLTQANSKSQKSCTAI